MKSILKILTVCLILIASCEKAPYPIEPVSLENRNYVGTFSVTFKNYQNKNTAITLSGTISFSFLDSSKYNYSAKITYSTDSLAYDSLNDSGIYHINDHKISLNDDSWMRMDARWHNSLYFYGTFTFKRFDHQILIIQNNSFANWKLTLQPKL